MSDKHRDLAMLAVALLEMPEHTLWCVGSMEDGPFARVVLPQPDGGYTGGYREAYADTPAEALRAAMAQPVHRQGDRARPVELGKGR